MKLSIRSPLCTFVCLLLYSGCVAATKHFFSDTTITGTVTYDDVVIHPGIIVTINGGTINMNTGRKITVMKHSILKMINSARITSTSTATTISQTSTWLGIELIGKPSSAQPSYSSVAGGSYAHSSSTDSQGCFVIQYDCTLERAYFGCVAGGINAPKSSGLKPTIDFTKGGGVVCADHAYFHNNFESSLYFTTYPAYSVSRITFCNFYDNYTSGSHGSCFIKMVEFRLKWIQYNDFHCQDFYRVGIDIQNSDLYAGYNTFEKLVTGVSGVATKSTYTFLEKNDFKNCCIGVYGKGLVNPEVYFNRFYLRFWGKVKPNLKTVTHTSADYDPSWGVFFAGCPLHHIYCNTFTQSGTAQNDTNSGYAR